jgi:LAO/AO transport system kinase
MASRGHLGGLSGTTAEAAAVLDACGFGFVLIETVGTGQSEVEVAAIADTTVVVQAPDMGDDVQALKAGLLEVADIVVVTKADRPGAERTAASLRAMLGPRVAGGVATPGWPTPKRPDVLLLSGVTGQGVPELLSALDARAAMLADDAAHAQAVRHAGAEAQVVGILVDRTRAALRDPSHRSTTDATLRAVAAHQLDPYAAADLLSDALGQADG